MGTKIGEALIGSVKRLLAILYHIVWKYGYEGALPQNRTLTASL